MNVDVTRIAEVDRLRDYVARVTGNGSVSRPDVVAYAVDRLVAEAKSDAHVETPKLAALTESALPPPVESRPTSPPPESVTCDGEVAPIAIAENSATSSTTEPSRTSPDDIGRGTCWIEGQSVVVRFAKVDARKDALKAAGFVCRDNYEWFSPAAQVNVSEVLCHTRAFLMSHKSAKEFLDSFWLRIDSGPAHTSVYTPKVT